VPILVGTHPDYLEHVPATLHPENPTRLLAIQKALSRLHDGWKAFDPIPATEAELSRVHDFQLVERVRELSKRGGGAVDADTYVSSGSFRAALRAAGTGITAAHILSKGNFDAAFLALRPPGHHADTARAMGFCLFNNIAVTASHLLNQGHKIAVIDFDAHHGNGTQNIFWDETKLLYASLHQYPLYPGTGDVGEVGGPSALGKTINVPLPPHASGATAIYALEHLILPAVAEFEPDWVLISAGFDGHCNDPLTQLRYVANDFNVMTTKILAVAPKKRVIVFLEGGYDFDAIYQSTVALLSGLLNVGYREEERTPHQRADRELVHGIAQMRLEALRQRATDAVS
jgi:acetoin utilization deacetylase AcuC-like enzyme